MQKDIKKLICSIEEYLHHITQLLLTCSFGKEVKDNFIQHSLTGKTFTLKEERHVTEKNYFHGRRLHAPGWHCALCKNAKKHNKLFENDWKTKCQIITLKYKCYRNLYISYFRMNMIVKYSRYSYLRNVYFNLLI